MLVYHCPPLSPLRLNWIVAFMPFAASGLMLADIWSKISWGVMNTPPLGGGRIVTQKSCLHACQESPFSTRRAADRPREGARAPRPQSDRRDDVGGVRRARAAGACDSSPRSGCACHHRDRERRRCVLDRVP